MTYRTQLTMQIFLTRAAGPMAGQKLTLDEAESVWAVDHLKEHVEEVHGIPSALQRIYSADGVEMVGPRTLAD